MTKLEKCLSNPFQGRKSHVWRYSGDNKYAQRKCAYCGLMEKTVTEWKPL